MTTTPPRGASLNGRARYASSSAPSCPVMVTVPAHMASFMRLNAPLLHREASVFTHIAGAPRVQRAVPGTRKERAAAPDRGRSGSASDLLGGLGDEAQLRRLLLGGQRVALDRGGEPALRRQADLVER